MNFCGIIQTVMKTIDQIIAYINQHTSASAKELVDFLEISDRAVFKHLARLIQSGQLVKVGTPPKVFYKLPAQTVSPDISSAQIDPADLKAIRDHYLYITPLGEPLEAEAGFVRWCQERSLDPRIQARQYSQVLTKINDSRQNGILIATNKFTSLLEDLSLAQVYYLDFYSIPQFGKTKLGQLLLYAKQSQDKKRIRQIAQMAQPAIEQLIKTHKFSAVGYIPPTVKREVQFMRQLEQNLALNLPSIKITKIKTDIVVPQKTLSKLSDRIINARNTLVVEESKQFDKVLLIDDAAGSGATLNETAKQLIDRGTAKQVYGLAIVGSHKGFDVISEV